MSKIIYPPVHRDEENVDEYHGVKIANPYKWLEDPDSKETQQFVAAQNEITDAFISDSLIREKFKDKLTELWDYPKYGCPFKRGMRYFYWFNSGLQNQSVLYVQESLDSTAEVFLDPNSMCEEGLQSISGLSFSEDGEILAYGVNHKGSDWVTVKFMKVATKEQLEEDTLENVKFSCMEWTHDNKGLFYNRYAKDTSKQDGTETAQNVDQKLYYHILGTKQEADVLVAEFPDHPKWMVHAEVSDDGKFVMLTISEGCDPVNQLYFYNLEENNYKINCILPYTKVVDNFNAAYSEKGTSQDVDVKNQYVTNTGSLFTFRTNLNAPRYKLINIDFNNFAMENWTVLVDEHNKDVLEWVACVNNDVLVICYLHDVKNKLYLHRLNDGHQFKELDLDVGTIRGYSGRKHHKEMFYSFTSFLTPGIIYRYDFTAGASTVFREINVKGFDHTQFETEQIFYKSKDGTTIPMFIIHRKGITLDGSHPCFLYGYGGFNISITPSFSVSRTIYIKHLGGVLAIANIRGGGEYGKEWHKAGCFAKRQNAYDDFISAAEYLVDQKYTKSERLTINGGSNGGLLVTACMNQRPDLFKCVVGQVSVTDLLNFHKYTIGHAWKKVLHKTLTSKIRTTDFGCSDKKEDFDHLLKLSPVHNVRKHSTSQYPSVLLLTADHDDRVVPLHSYKLIATLQHTLGACENQVNPLLIKIDTKSGHGAGKPTAKVIEETSDIYAFISKNVKASWID